MKALVFLDTFEDNIPDQQQATLLKLNYPLEDLLKNQDVVKWLDDLKLQISLLPEAPTMDYEEAEPDFKLTGSQQSVDSAIDVILKALKPLPYVKVWKDGVVVLDNFSKDYKAQEDGPPTAAPAGPASSADIAGRTNGSPVQPGATMGGSVNSLGALPLGVFGVVKYSFRKEKELKPKKGKRKKMLPKPNTRIGEQLNKAELLSAAVDETKLYRREPDMKVVKTHTTKDGGTARVLKHPKKGFRVDYEGKLTAGDYSTAKSAESEAKKLVGKAKRRKNE